MKFQHLMELEVNYHIPTFTSARHLSIPWASSIQSITPHRNSWRSILILSSHLRPCFPSGFFPSGFPTKTLYTLLLSPHTCYMPGPSNSSRFNRQNNIVWAVQIIKLLIKYSLLHSPVTSSLLGPNNLLNTLFSDILSLRSSLTVSDQVSHPYKTTVKNATLHTGRYHKPYLV